MIFDKDTDSDGDCIDGGGSTRYFYCQQANYNVVALTNSSGTVVEKIEYDPYGEYTLTLDGSTDNPFLFQGRRWDSEADLYYFRNRSYSPRLGRFLQRDPIGYMGGMNLYEFCVGAARWERIAPKVSLMLRDDFESCLTVCPLPADHRRWPNSTNMLERVMKELKRRNRVVGIFPDRSSCDRLIGARLMELHEAWEFEDQRHLCMDALERPEYDGVMQFTKSP